jgi:hypothetical protein
MTTSQKIRDFVDQFNSPENVAVRVEDDVVTLMSDDFSKVPATGDSPDTIYVSKTMSGQLDVRPVGSGAERMEVSPAEAVTYINNMFL